MGSELSLEDLVMDVRSAISGSRAESPHDQAGCQAPGASAPAAPDSQNPHTPQPVAYARAGGARLRRRGRGGHRRYATGARRFESPRPTSRTLRPHPEDRAHAPDGHSTRPDRPARFFRVHPEDQDLPEDPFGIHDDL